MIEMTKVPIANVGVVIAYVGSEGVDVTGDAFKHGNLVSRGQKGVWVAPLDPGKYPLNTYTHKVEIVPTANVVLNWATGKTEAHNLDKNLSTITVRSSDGFTFNLDVSQIIHIPRTEAPKVIARFGSMANLVTQVLEPTIGNYFRNAAQNSDVIDFLKQRTARQHEAKTSIAKALEEYNVGAVDTLIGDITPPDALMKTLTDRKIAEQEKMTYNTQKEAEEVRKSLAQAKAQADTQPSVVKSLGVTASGVRPLKNSDLKTALSARPKPMRWCCARSARLRREDHGRRRGRGWVIKQKTAAMDPEKCERRNRARAGGERKLGPRSWPVAATVTRVVSSTCCWRTSRQYEKRTCRG
jgi:hypothetical protein